MIKNTRHNDEEILTTMMGIPARLPRTSRISARRRCAILKILRFNTGFNTYDKVSANTARSFPQCYEKSDGSKDARRDSLKTWGYDGSNKLFGSSMASKLSVHEPAIFFLSVCTEIREKVIFELSRTAI